MAPVKPTDGPVAVTGANGYIGSWNVHELVEHGYHVHACMRDTRNPVKVSHLLEMNDKGLRGQVTLKQGDLKDPGSYDDAFAGCVAVMHTGTPMPSGDTAQQDVYDGCFTQIDHVLESARKAGTVKRFLYTSSLAAVIFPAPDDYVFTETDWCGDEGEDYVSAYRGMFPPGRMVAYSMGKANAERKLYRYAEVAESFDAVSIIPALVAGPVMCQDHDKHFQRSVKKMLMGLPIVGRHMCIVDVRDVAQAHRLGIESSVAGTGSRYIIGAADDSGILYTPQLQEKMKALFPQFENIGGESDRKMNNYERCYSTLAKQELGLTQYSVDETIKATGDSYIALGLVEGA